MGYFDPLRALRDEDVAFLEPGHAMKGVVSIPDACSVESLPWQFFVASTSQMLALQRILEARSCLALSLLIDTVIPGSNLIGAHVIRQTITNPSRSLLRNRAREPRLYNSQDSRIDGLYVKTVKDERRSSFSIDAPLVGIFSHVSSSQGLVTRSTVCKRFSWCTSHVS